MEGYEDDLGGDLGDFNNIGDGYMGDLPGQDYHSRDDSYHNAVKNGLDIHGDYDPDIDHKAECIQKCIAERERELKEALDICVNQTRLSAFGMDENLAIRFGGYTSLWAEDSIIKAKE